MSDKPVRPSLFLEALNHHNKNASPEVKLVVEKAAQFRNMKELMQHLEIIDNGIAREFAMSVMEAVGDKLAHDLEHSTLGHRTLPGLLQSIAMISLVLGAHLAKEKKI